MGLLYRVGLDLVKLRPCLFELSISRPVVSHLPPQHTRAFYPSQNIIRIYFDNTPYLIRIIEINTYYILTRVESTCVLWGQVCSFYRPGSLFNPTRKLSNPTTFYIKWRVTF
eukprot:sb/3477047/